MGARSARGALGALGVLTAQIAVLAQGGQELVTYNTHIAPLVEAHCAGCHRPDDVGPFPLLTYADVRPRAALIAQVTERRSMPPWMPAGPRATFRADRSLTDEQIALFRKWVADGAIEGAPDDRTRASARQARQRWQLGTPDLILTMDEPFAVPASGGNLFRTFVLPIRIPSTRFVRAIEFHPGNARVVHHANLGIDRTEASRRRDEREPGPGYAGGMIPEASYPSGQLLGWAPGQSARLVPEGTAWPLEPGGYFNMQLHLQPTGSPERVQASVGIYFTDRAPTRAPAVVRLGSQTLAIPPGDPIHVVTDTYVLPVDAEVVAVQAHAHYLARRVEARAILPDRSERPLLNIPAWDFHWQDVYEYAKPVVLPKGTILASRFTYDNSANNPRNPHSPPRLVNWGQNTSDEMGDVWLQVIAVNAAEAPRLAEDIGRKILAGNTAAFMKLVEREPANPQLREGLAIVLLQAGRMQDAIVHFNEFVRLQPDSAAGHYNLGNALAAGRQFQDAARAYQRAVDLDPALGEAHGNLGAMLSMLGRPGEALNHFERAVALRPDSVEAQTNLGRMLAMQNRLRDAAGHLQTAIVLKPDAVSAVIELAWIRATTDDPDLRDVAEASRLAERAVALTGRRDAAALDALAATQAAGGRFDEAVTTGRLAIDAAAAAGATTLAAEIRSRVALYERRQPYRRP
jgi:tetratricopeptide (TPR) repeat protein